MSARSAACRITEELALLISLRHELEAFVLLTADYDLKIQTATEMKDLSALTESTLNTFKTNTLDQYQNKKGFSIWCGCEKHTKQLEGIIGMSAIEN